MRKATPRRMRALAGTPAIAEPNLDKSLISVTAGSSGYGVHGCPVSVAILSVDSISTIVMILGVGGLVNKAG
jgi:hypothetical protein